MRLEHLYGIDLSLLVVLHVLLEERSVTRAARRLGRSQPATSRALQRLRELLDDPLFVRQGGTLQPTPRAQEVAAPLADALAMVDTAVLAPPSFDPATDHRELRILSADFAEGMWLPRPLAALARAAPRIDVVILANKRGWSVADALRTEAHLAVGPVAGDAASIRAVHVGEETFAVLLRADHPAAGALDLDRYTALPHLLVAPGGTPGGVVDTALASLGRARRVAVRTRHFQTAPELLAHSDLIATLPRRFAEIAAARHGLRLLPPPLALPSFPIHIAWHERWQRDPGHRWIRERLARSLRDQL